MTTPLQCPACGAQAGNPLQCQCGHSRTAKEIESLDYFTLFGMPTGYALQRPALEKAYLQLSRAVHPDRNPGAGQVGAMRRLAAFVNEAYAVLKDPVRRADYLVRLWGGAPADEGRKMTPAFLAEQLELREAAEEADEEARERLRQETAGRLAAHQLAVEQCLSAGPHEVVKARRLLDEMQFYRTFLRDLNQGEPR
jgi:molecular chaperone HscB